MVKKQSKIKKISKKRISRRNKKIIQKGGNQDLINVISDPDKTPEQITLEVRELVHDTSSKLKDKPIDLDKQDEYGRTSLYIASEKGNADVVKLLVDAGANVNKRDKNENSPLHIASYMGHIDVLKVLLSVDNIDVNVREKTGVRPIQFAAGYGHLGAVEALLTHPDINVNGDGNNVHISKKRLNPLFYALINNHIDIVKALIKHPKINLEDGGHHRETALGFASREGMLDIVIALLENGADVESDSEFTKPLCIASENGHVDVVRALLKQGANHKVICTLQETPLYIASEKGYVDVVNALLEVDSSEDYINKTTVSKMTPLHIASENGHADVVRSLLCEGAEVNPLDMIGNSPLFFASKNRHADVVNVLLSHPDIRVSAGRRLDGKTVVSVAAEKKGGPDESDELVERLMHEFILEVPNYGKLQAGKDRTLPEWRKAVERRGLAEVVVKGRSHQPYTVITEDDSGETKQELVEGKQLPLGFGCRKGAIGEFIGGKRKTKKSKAKKDSKKRSSRRNKTQEGGNQELITAADRGNEDDVRKLLMTVDPNFMNSNNVTPLMLASWRGNLNIVRMLLDHGANVNTPNSNFNPLNEAAISGHIDVVNELLDRGADPTWVDMFGLGILERVNTETNNPEMVELLIRKGILNGYTREHAERDGVLEQYQERINTEREIASEVVRDATPMLPLDLGHPRGPIRDFIGGKRKTKRSKAKKGPKNRVSRRNKIQEGGSQELIDAVVRNDTNTVYNILNTGVNVNYMNYTGSTPLLVAVRRGNLDIVRLLLDYGAMLQAPGSNFNALKEAAMSGHIHVVNELLDRGANPGWVDMFGKGIVERVNTESRLNLNAVKRMEMVDLLIRKGIPQYTREDAERDGVLAQYDQIVLERRALPMVVRDASSLPMDFGHPKGPIGSYFGRHFGHFGGKRKTKRVSRRNKTQEGGSQSLINAVMRNDMDSVYNFLNTPGVDVNYTNNNGVSPLIFASWRGYLNIVRLLLDYGAIVQTPNSNVNALGEAAISGHIHVVNELLDRGADPEWPERVDMFGKSIVERVKNNPEMVDLLIRKGIPRYTRQNAERDGVLAQYDQIYLELRALSTVVRDTTNLPLNFGNREGPIGSYFGRFGGKRKTKRSKAKKGPKNRVSRRNKTQAGGTQTLINAVVRNDNDMVTNILKTGVDVNYTNNNGVTPLIVACRNGNLDIVRLLLDYGAMLQAPGSNFNALKEAAMSGHIHVVNELLDRGANPGWVDMFGMGIVERVKNNPEMVYLLIRKGTPQYTREDAERDGVLEQYNQIIMERRAASSVVRQVNPQLPLDVGYDIRGYIGGKRKTKRISRRNKTQAGGDNETEDEMLARVQKIYDEDRDINELNKADRKGKTLLHYASEKGYSSVVEDLIQYKAVEINKIRKETGKTALHYASENGHWKVVEILLNEDDIDVNIQDKKGKTALHYASENGHGKVVEILFTADKYIDVNIQDKKGKTPLHYAYDKGDEVAIGELRIAGAKEDIVDIAGNVPVYYSLIDHNKVIKNILSHGDAINAPSHN
uniref:Uncharacterized protein n=1 Tax=viral metagenome TaxID=1070528 RepID=A0A6C0AUX0_9ZZZZ